MKEERNVTKNNQQSSGIRLLRWIPAIILMVIIFVLSAKTGDELDQALPFFQRIFPWISDFNWGHYVAYFALAMTYDYALGSFGRTIRGKMLIILLCACYGASDEWHQSFVGGRMMDWMDLRNDVIGATVWVLLSSLPFVQKIWSKLTK